MNAFPRVSVPGVDPEAVEALQADLSAHEEHRAHIARERKGLSAAFARLGKRPARRPRSKARPTRNVLTHRTAAVRSAYLKEISA